MIITRDLYKMLQDEDDPDDDSDDDPDDDDDDGGNLCDGDPTLATTARKVKHPATFCHQPRLQWVDLAN